MPTQKQLRRQAKLLSKIRFGDQIGALAQMLSDAQSQRNIGIRNAREGASSLAATLEQLRPKIQSAYQGDVAARGAAGQEAGAAMAGLSGPVVDAIRAASAREAQAGAGRASLEQANALTDVGSRQANAKAGAIYETKAAQSAYASDANKIFGQLSNLRGQQGAFIETTLADLNEKQRARVIQDANLELDRDQFEETIAENLREDERASATLGETRRHNVASEREARRKRRADAKKKGGVKGITQDQQNRAVDRIESAKSWGRKLRADGWKQADIYKALRNGYDAEDENGNKIKVPAFEHAYVNAGMDLVYNKRLTKPNIDRLHSRGVSIPGRWRKRKR